MTALFWCFAGPALVLGILSLAGERKRAAYFKARLGQSHDSPLQPATLIVPLKGHDEGLRENLRALAGQDHPDYELIIVARQAGDIPPGVLPDSARILLAHSAEENTSEKIQNLQCAVRHARRTSRVLAFADADGRVPAGWLRALVEPLAEPGVGASTGYRWYVPQPADFWSLLRSVWNAPIEGLLGPGENPFAWGGAMAICRDLFAELQVAERWKGQISDDYVLSAAVRGAGLRVAYAPGAIVPASDHIGGREFFRWAKRQMILTRAHNPGLWAKALVAHIFYCGGMAACVIAAVAGRPATLAVLAGIVLPGIWKGVRRARLARLALPQFREWFRAWQWIYSWPSPLCAWVWLGVLVHSATARHIEWRGRRYCLPPG